MRLAMIEIDKILNQNSKYKTKMLLQIHDELIFESPKNECKVVMSIIKKTMSSITRSEHHIFSVPLIVDINSGNNWGEVR